MSITSDDQTTESVVIHTNIPSFLYGKFSNYNVKNGLWFKHVGIYQLRTSSDTYERMLYIMFESTESLVGFSLTYGKLSEYLKNFERGYKIENINE